MNVEDWRTRVKSRQERFCTPRIICPFVNRLINIGVLPVPEQGYIVKWPDVSTQNEKEKVQIQSMRINIIVAYVKNGLEKFMPAVEFLVRFLDMEEEEAKTLVELTKKEIQKGNALTITEEPEQQTIPPNDKSKVGQEQQAQEVE
jgi:hypothetical protein